MREIKLKILIIKLNILKKIGKYLFKDINKMIMTASWKVFLEKDFQRKSRIMKEHFKKMKTPLGMKYVPLEM